MSQFAIDIELVGGPGCGTQVLEIPEDQEIYAFVYTRQTAKGERTFTATYGINSEIGRAFYING